MEIYNPLPALLAIPEPAERARAVSDVLKQLPDLQNRLRMARHHAVLEMRARGMSHAEVARELGVTRSRAQQIAEGKTKTRATKE